MTDIHIRPEDRQLTRRPSPFDVRDLSHRMRAVTPREVVIVSKYWTTGPILDQGDTPQCVGYSGGQFLQTEPVITMDGPTPTALYDLAQRNDEWPGTDYDGSSVRGLAKGLIGLGRLKSYVWGTSAAEVRDFIITTGPALAGTDWLSNMFYPDPKTGTLKVSGSLAGGHAYLLSGYDARYNRFEMTNSWGKSWGKSGKAWIKFNDLDRLIARQGEMCAAIEQPVTAAQKLDPIQSVLDTVQALQARLAELEERLTPSHDPAPTVDGSTV